MKAHIQKPAGPRITACTIVKDEAANIARSIRSYRDFVDEIIVVDTGSKDDTARIAGELGARVLHFAWRDDFSAAKNYALDAATGDWIVFPDADEYFCEGCGKRVREAIETAQETDCNVIFCPLVNIDSNDNDRFLSEFAQARIFKADARYVLPVHETISVSEGFRAMRVGRDKFYLLHTGYSSAIREEKTRRNLELLEAEDARNTDPDVHFLLQAYLASTYATLGQYEKALWCAEAYFRRPEGRTYEAAMDIKAAHALYGALVGTGADACTALRWTDAATPACLNHPDVLYAQGCMLLAFRLFAKALSLHKKAFACFEDYTAVEECTFQAKLADYYYTLGLCMEGLGRCPDALDAYVKALDTDGDCSNAIKRLCALVKGTPQSEIERFMGALFANAGTKKRGYILSGLMANYMSEPLIRLYAVYYKEENLEKLDPGIAAFIAAGNGNYRGAAGLFLEAYKIADRPDTATRALLCAVLSADRDTADQVLKICNPKQAGALGLVMTAGFVKEDIPLIALLVLEAGRMRGGSYAASLAREVAGRVGETFYRELALQLEKHSEFDGALAVAEMMPFTPGTAFLRGYYSCRLGRPDEAAVWLKAAQHMGYAQPDLPAVLANIGKLQGEGRPAAPQQEPGRIKEAAIAAVGRGGYPQAVSQIRQYRRLCPEDPESYSVEAVACYQAGDFKRAAAAVEAGLLGSEQDCDLLFNGGEVYLRLGERDKAAVFYQKALEHCEPGGFADQIKAALSDL